MNNGKMFLEVVARWIILLRRKFLEVRRGILTRDASSVHLVPQQEGSSQKRNAKWREGTTKRRTAKREIVSSKKKDYRVEGPGTMWLFDGANLLGSMGSVDAAVVFSMVEREMKERGYKVMIFLERRCLFWAIKNQDSAAAKKRLKEYVGTGNVTLVDNESDLSLLQAARVIPGAVIVSHDRFRDYRATFDDVLRTHRVVGFSCMKTEDRLVLSIWGLKDAIVIPLTTPDRKEPATQAFAASKEKDAVKRVWTHDNVKAGYLVWGERLLQRGNVEKAVSCFGKLIKRKDAAGYRALAGLYEGTDARNSRKYECLADRLEKKIKEKDRRDLRVGKERCRMSKAS